MSEWVLVPIEFDSETYEEIWTAAVASVASTIATAAAYNEWAEFGSRDKDAGRAAVVAMFAARPPIPYDVWDTMVERAARAAQSLLESRWEDLDLGEQDDAQRVAEVALRAALGNPLVEGDAP